MRNIKRIFIHCTASSRKTSIEQLLAEFKSRGWHAPGYHYVAMPDGRMVKLLDEEKVSNGVRGYNQSAINIAYVGGIDAKGRPTDNRTIEQKAAIIHLLIELRSRYPNALIRATATFGAPTIPRYGRRRVRVSMQRGSMGRFKPILLKKQNPIKP